MQGLTLFYLPECPHCNLARQKLAELQTEDPRYAGVPVELVDERREKARADAHDYWYVPCFYLGDQKLFEGHMEKPDVRAVLETALKA